MDHLLIPLSVCYVKRNEPITFILHLLQVNVECLLIIRDNDKDDVKVVENFEVFLHRYISEHNIVAKLPEHFHQIKVSYCSLLIFIMPNIVTIKVSEQVQKNCNECFS